MWPAPTSAPDGEPIAAADPTLRSRPLPRARLVAVATSDPLSPSTFSGLSANLFEAVMDEGVEVLPIATRVLTWTDIASGALRPSALLHPKRSQRGRPRIRPNWYWSRRGYQRFCGRFDARLGPITAGGTLLQIGTHVRTSLPGWRSFCITDATVPQCASSDWYAIAHASPKVIAQAIACQAEVFRSCEKVFTLSDWAARSVVSDFNYPAERVVTVGAGASLGDQRPRRVDAEHPYVLFVGKDWEQKGGPLLLEAFHLLRSTNPSVRLKVVGCEPDVSVDGVDIVGFLDKGTEAGRDELMSLYAGATCFSILSEVDAFPNVLLEAGHMGVPVVSTNEGSRAEIVRDGVTGILVPQRDPELIVAAIQSLLDDPGLCDVMGRAAQIVVGQSFTWPVVVRRILHEMGMGAETQQADEAPA